MAAIAPNTLPRQRKVRAEIDQASKEQRFEDDARGGKSERNQERRRSEYPVGRPGDGEMTSGMWRRLAHRRRDVSGKRRLAALALGRVAHPSDPYQHGAAHDHLLFVARRRRAPHAPVVGRHQVRRYGSAARLLPDLAQRALGIAAGEPARLVQGTDHSERRIQGGHRLPALRAGLRRAPPASMTSRPIPAPAARVLSPPRNISDAVQVRHAAAGTGIVWTNSSSAKVRARSHRRPVAGSIDLDEGSMAAPGDHEVQQSAGVADHDDAGQHVSGRREDVIDGKQDLFGDETDVVREIFQRVDSTCHRRRSGTPREGVHNWRADRIRRAGISGPRARSPSRRSARPPAQATSPCCGPSPPRQRPEP
jgi:hypothetical protein